MSNPTRAIAARAWSASRGQSRRPPPAERVQLVEHDVLGDAGLGHHLDLLMDQANTFGRGQSRQLRTRSGAPSKSIRPGVGLVYAGDNFEQGALASAVFAD